MNQVIEAEKQSSSHVPDRELEVIVNERPVTLVGHRHTGLEIKQAAIQQGVPIQLDFVLSVEHGHGQTKLVGDTDEITITKNSRFVAIPDDDNSQVMQ